MAPTRRDLMRMIGGGALAAILPVSVSAQEHVKPVVPDIEQCPEWARYYRELIVNGKYPGVAMSVNELGTVSFIGPFGRIIANHQDGHTWLNLVSPDREMSGTFFETSVGVLVLGIRDDAY